MEVRLQLLVKATFFLLFLLKGQFQDIFDPCVSMVMDLTVSSMKLQEVMHLC